MCTVYRHKEKKKDQQDGFSNHRVDHILLSARQIARQARVNPSVARASLNRVRRDSDHTCSDMRKPVFGPSIAMSSLSNVRHFVLVIFGRDHFLTTRAPPLCVKKQQDGMYCHHFGLTSPANTTSKCTYKAFRNLPSKNKLDKS